MVEQSSESASDVVESFAGGRASWNRRMASTASPRLLTRRFSLADFLEVPGAGVGGFVFSVAVDVDVLSMSGVVFGAVLVAIRPGVVVLSFSASVCNKFKREGKRGEHKKDEKSVSKLPWKGHESQTAAASSSDPRKVHGPQSELRRRDSSGPPSHNTKGEHNVHKNEEYEKKQEFYDEFHEGGDEEKHGAFHQESDYKKGDSQKSGHHKSDHHKDSYGKKGHHEKGERYNEDKGHKVVDAHDEHYKHKDKHGKKGGHKELKNWGHKQGESTGANKGVSHTSDHSIDNDGTHHFNTQLGDYLIENYGDDSDGYGGDHASDSHTYYTITHY
ncbi:hypothetical protein Trydic_g9808 [Trypoxylus dichotomus]